jgi:hypothetical protein
MSESLDDETIEVICHHITYDIMHYKSWLDMTHIIQMYVHMFYGIKEQALGL